MPAKELLLAVAMAVDTFTGVILLQSSQAISMAGPSPPHFDPLADTRLGGAIMWVGGDAIMAVIMVIVAVAWVRLPERRRRESRSWLEQARRDTFIAHTAAVSETQAIGDVDTDEQARAAYNAWLKRLDRTR
jgi:putative copper resistance protein D